ncbi:hypothetical protein LAV73_09405 [Lysinibacillus xylanilyticus]|uniref:hypothetical protein n=1 Tax=Lysinibacillus xylanilyticus TaxID=582475 RepID=UPI002B24F8A8|nr:hypothetical protein [Lysinibacillus xylanilyticus]MEB2280210.1 hypothetical protein [Lysinibacillus xylanilyticus]
MLICKDELYTDIHSVGQFKVYLALEDAQNVNDIVKVIELVSDTAVFLTSRTVITFEGNLERELLDVAIKYNSKL